MQGITQYDGLYGQDPPRPHAESLFSELLETRSRTFGWVIQPHLHARLFQVFFLQKGQVAFREATRQRDLSAPLVLLIPPASLHGLTYSPDTTGRILTLSDALVESLVPPDSVLTPMLASVQCVTRFQEPYPPETIGELMGEIDRELSGHQPEKRTMLRVELQRLFLVLFRIWQHDQAREAPPNPLAMQYFRRFQQLVRQAGTTRSVAQLADQLAITPVHLNRICRAVAGKPAGQLVQEHLLHEACKYLAHTSYSVSEIAYLLHFEYPNYFARFFRKHTGLSPTAFRAALPTP